MEQKEIQTQVQQGINSLETDDAFIIILHDLQEVPYEEIGRILEVPLGTVKSRLHRARQALKERLSHHFKSTRVEK